MSLFKRYSPNYEGGKCPIGFEFVKGYWDNNRIWHDSYCRKIRKLRVDPETKANEKERREFEKSLDQVRKEYWENSENGEDEL